MSTQSISWLFAGILISILTCCKEKATNTSATPVHVSRTLAHKNSVPDIAQSAYSHTAKILEFGPRPPQSSALAKVKQYCISELKKHGWQTVEQEFQQQTPNGKLRFSNLISRFTTKPGSSPWKRKVSCVLAAHIDSKILEDFVGADDAASCVGSLLALAKYMSEHHPEIAAQVELVFFDGEEAIGPNMTYMGDGLYGSIYYSKMVQRSAANQLSPYKSVPKFGIVLDMIAHKNLDIKIPSDTPTALAAAYDAARKKHGLEKHFDHSESAFLDDHYPMNAIAKIPTIDLIGDFFSNKWWHTSADSFDNLSVQSLEMSLLIALEIMDNQFKHSEAQ